MGEVINSQNEKIFCAQESVNRREGFLGTTTHYNCYLLVEYHGSWSCDVSNLLENSRVSESAKKHILAFMDWCPEDVKFLFIKRDNNKAGPFKLFLTKALNGKCGVREFDFDDYADIAKIDLNLAYENILNEGGEQKKDILVVCTHGKRDKCCAKYGYPIYKRLSSALTEPSGRFSVWECSHVGGDRFAANAIWLPHGYGFGHCQNATEVLLSKIKENKISLEHFRGASTIPDAAQYLEGVIREENGLESPGGVTLVHYDEQAIENEKMIAHVGLVFSGLGNRRVTADVISFFDTSNDMILASCNKNGYTYPFVFEAKNIVVS